MVESQSQELCGRQEPAVSSLDASVRKSKRNRRLHDLPVSIGNMLVACWKLSP